MSNYTENLQLKLPLGSKNWNLDTWNENMKILDKAFPDLQEIVFSNIGADDLTVSSNKLQSTQAQDALDELSEKSAIIRYVNVTDTSRILVPAEGHLYLILSFGETVPEISFEKTPSDSQRELTWLNGSPRFKPNRTYEISIMKMYGIWYRRDEQIDYSQFFDYYIEDNILYVTRIKATDWYDAFGNYDITIPSTILGYPVMLDGYHE